jgi:hypothetical protein
MIPLAWVKRYQELGFIVHPCCPPDHRCQSPGKIPYDPYERQHMAGWQNHDQFTLEKWAEWLDLDPTINIGFLTGSPSKIVAVDIDDAAGEEMFRAAVSEEERATWQFRTGKGTRFLYAVQHGPVRSARVSSGSVSVEILGDGRQTVLPPSVHPSGKEYLWVDGASPRACKLLGAPAPILLSTPEIDSERVDWEEAVTTPTQEGSRNETLTRLAGHLLAPASVPADEVFLWLKLYSSACCKPPLSEAEIKMIVRSIQTRQERSDVQAELETRRLMREHNLKWHDADMMRRGMCG